MDIKWLEPWDSLCTDGSLFDQELYKKVRQGHVLYDKRISVLGRRYDCDEFLLSIRSSKLI